MGRSHQSYSKSTFGKIFDQQAILFEKVLKELLSHLRQQWMNRQKRPLPDSVNFALSRFEKVWIVDGSTLEALFRKLKSLEDVPRGKLAGKKIT